MAVDKGYRDKPRFEEHELDTVILERTVDPVRAAMVRNILEAADIVVSTPGYEAHNTAGVTGAFEISIRVPQKDLDRAREALEARGALSSKITAPLTRRWRASIMVALVPGFGAGHVHAGAYLSALLLGAAELMAIAATTQGAIMYPLLAIAFPILGDVLGSRAACDRANAGQPVTMWLSPGAIAGIALVPAYLFVMGQWAPSVLASEDVRRTCAYEARCLDGDLGTCLAEWGSAESAGYPPSHACASCLEHVACDEAVARCDDECAFDR
jgi:hypothetical protein